MSPTSPPPLCPEKPYTRTPQAPHRDRPGRARPEPQERPQRKKRDRPPRKWQEGEYERFQQIVENHRRRRDEALQTIAHFRGKTRAMDPGEVRAARAYLDTWRDTFLADVRNALPELYDLKPPSPYTRPEKPYRPATPGSTRATDFRSLVNAWRSDNQPRLSAMSTPQLQAGYLASRVLRHAGEVLALTPYLDVADVAFVQIQATRALKILESDLKQPQTEEYLTALLDLPLLPDPIMSPIVAAEVEELTPETPGGLSDQVPPAQPAQDPMDWMRANANQIDEAIRTYMADNRWNALGPHFGAIIQQINDLVLPTILADPDVVQTELTAETAVFISLLKAGLVPDHTDDLDAVVAWFEDLVLWIEDHARQELPPSIIVDYALIHEVPLLPLGPTPL